MNDYGKLLAEVTKGITDGSIKLEDAPTLKALVDRHLTQYDNQINSAVNNLKDTADDDQRKLNGLSGKKWSDIANTGNAELNSLRDTVQKNLNKNQINYLVQTNIKGQISKALGMSKSQVQHYFSALDDNSRQVGQLNGRISDLTKRLDKANKKTQDTKKNFWYGVFGAFVLGGLCLWIALGL